MFKNDYLLRMIEEFGAMLRKALALEEDGEYEKAHGQIDAAMKRLGVSRLLTRSMPATELLRMVRMGGTSDERCFMLSHLIGADAHIYRSKGLHDVAHNLYATELSVLTTIKGSTEDEKSEMIEKEIEAVRLLITENARDDANLSN